MSNNGGRRGGAGGLWAGGGRRWGEREGAHDKFTLQPEIAGLNWCFKWYIFKYVVKKKSNKD